MRLIPSLGAAHRVKSWLLSYWAMLPEAIAAAERALELNRNDTLAHQLLALYELQSGHAERSRELIQQAMRLSPRDPNEYRSLHILARAEIALNEPDRALDHLQQAIVSNPEMHFVRLFVATAHGRAGRHREARQAIDEFVKFEPHLFQGQSPETRIIMRAQLELAARGYYLGTVDGRLGPFTQQALLEFQLASGLPPSSELDAPTLSRLNECLHEQGPE
jgi:tetratricopeptide (TPR) repeat protein